MEKKLRETLREKTEGPATEADQLWQTFLDGLNAFTDDIFADGRDQGTQEERDFWQ